MKPDKIVKFHSASQWNGYLTHSHPANRNNKKLCITTIKKFFKIPRNTKEIFIRLSHKKTEDSYLVDYDPHRMPHIKIILENSISRAMLYHSAFTVIKAFGMPCYVSLEYNDANQK